MTTDKEFSLTVDGQDVPDCAVQPVVDPSTAKPFAVAPLCDLATLNRAIHSARKSLHPWGENEAARREALQNISRLLRKRVFEIANRITSEQGKPGKKAVEEVMGASGVFASVARTRIPVQHLIDSAPSLELHPRPFGIVAAITASNYPILLAAWKLAPALLAGNTVILKPSPDTPIATLELGVLLREALPPGVVQVVNGDHTLGAALVSHPEISLVSFTGSIETGKWVQSLAAQSVKKTILELGGNDPAIVLEDVEPERVAQCLFRSAFENAGQRCVAIKRLYVPQTKLETFAQALFEIAQQVHIGPGLDRQSELGPLTTETQLHRVGEMIDEADQAGASVRRPQSPMPTEGYFHAPTIVTHAPHDQALTQEEQFAPVLPIHGYTSIDDAIAKANSTRYGLGASVWSSNLSEAKTIADQLECGVAWINHHAPSQINLPISGIKQSGIGYENGILGILDYTALQTRSTSSLPELRK